MQREHTEEVRPLLASLEESRLNHAALQQRLDQASHNADSHAALKQPLQLEFDQKCKQAANMQTALTAAQQHAAQHAKTVGHLQKNLAAVKSTAVMRLQNESAGLQKQLGACQG